MSDKLCKRRITPPKPNDDMSMNEILRGLEDVAAILSYTPWPGEFEIVAISSQIPREKTIIQARPTSRRSQPGADIIPFPQPTSRRP